MKSQSALVNSLQTEDTTTFNGAITNSTSSNSVVDLFFIAGASRGISDVDLTSMLHKAWNEDALKTLKLIFWAGDIREGVGERRFFRVGLQFLNKFAESTLAKNIELVPLYNRFDSLFNLPDSLTFPFIYQSLQGQYGPYFRAMCAKWMPRKKQYNNLAARFKITYNLQYKTYRKMLTTYTDVVEQKMCARQWDKIKYQNVPSVAFNNYKGAFRKHDGARYAEFIDSVLTGEKKINSKVLFPYQIFQSYKKNDDRKTIIAQWNNLPDLLENTNERFIPVCDVSGSMSGLPMDISVSLGVYLSERNKSVFKDAFITFSNKPELCYLSGDVYSRFEQLSCAHWEMNTNLIAVFELILNKAKAANLPEQDMPTKVLVISDMEFDAAAGNSATNYDHIRSLYVQNGYKMPQLVFWNVNGRLGNLPVKYDKNGTALISGATPNVIKGVLEGNLNPEIIMNKTLNSDRYNSLVI